jgi:hypothetical protein
MTGLTERQDLWARSRSPPPQIPCSPPMQGLRSYCDVQPPSMDRPAPLTDAPRSLAR